MRVVDPTLVLVVADAHGIEAVSKSPPAPMSSCVSSNFKTLTLSNKKFHVFPCRWIGMFTLPHATEELL